VTQVTLLTDFGGADGYAAAMKGVIAGIAPGVAVDDVSHDIEPGDIRGAAWALFNYFRFYPPGAVHLVVVDPGVGGQRRVLAAEIDSRYFVGPDNGILTHVLEDAEPVRAVELVEPRFRRAGVAPTFHGRDILAPAAAHLALGVDLALFGPGIADPVRFPIARPVRLGGEIRGEIIHVDRFGNLITNIPGRWLEGASWLDVAGSRLDALARTYCDVRSGELVAVIGSSDRLEIALRDGSAADALAIGRGQPVRIGIGG